MLKQSKPHKQLRSYRPFCFFYLFIFSTHAESELTHYATLTIDSSHVISGGLERDFTSRMLFDGGFDYQFDNQQIVVSYQANRGDNGSDSVGDIQAYSNIDEDNFSRVYEFYYQYQGQDWYVKVGKTDANAEFAIADPSGDFINSSMGFSPTIVGFPTYPTPALSLVAGLDISDSLQVAGGIFAASSSTSFAEQFYVTELRYQLSESSQVKIGYWHDSNTYDSLKDLASPSQSESGYYLIAQSKLANQHWLNAEHVNWYCQIGHADELASEIKWHIGSGLEFSQPFGLVDHGMGIGISHVKLSQHIEQSKGTETAIEAYYLWSANDHLILKPDLQYIVNPSGNQQINNALVFTLRLELSL
jgi:porin